MDARLLEQLRKINEEEAQILADEGKLRREIYTEGDEFMVDADKMLSKGQTITVRKHTRFAHFPAHRHNFVEMIYVVQGEMVNIISDKRVVVKPGEILLLNQHTYHEILPAGEEDLAINFMVLPQFLEVAREMVGEGNVLGDFVVNLLRQSQEKGEYLHFKVADVHQIQNLMENIIISLLEESPSQPILQTTMGLLFMHLVQSARFVETSVPNRYDNMITMTVLDYIEHNYKDASLTELTNNLNMPLHALSKTIKAQTGSNYTELLLRKRLNKAVQLLCDTDLSVNDIILAVGYENFSYFHRVFKARYHMTPKAFRREYANRKEVPM